MGSGRGSSSAVKAEQCVNSLHPWRTFTRSSNSLWLWAFRSLAAARYSFLAAIAGVMTIAVAGRGLSATPSSLGSRMAFPTPPPTVSKPAFRSACASLIFASYASRRLIPPGDVTDGSWRDIGSTPEEGCEERQN